MPIRWSKVIIAWLLGFVLAVTCYAQQEQAQDKALSIRAARLDAMRQLSETIEGLHISATTQVKDFITESDEVHAFLTAFLQDAQQVGQPQYRADGTCEVTMSVSIDEVIQFLQEAWQQHPSKIVSSAKQFEQIRHYTRQQAFIATGRGGVRHASSRMSPAGNVWERVHPRGKLMALRAAQVDAYRNLAETIKGIRLSSRTTVRDFVTESDEIRTAFNEFISGLEIVGAPRYRADGVVEVMAQVQMEKVLDALSAICKTLYSGKKWNIQSFEKLRTANNSRLIKASGLGVPPAKYVFQETPEEAPYQKLSTPRPSPAEMENNTPEKNGTKSAHSGKNTPEWALRTLRVKGIGTFYDSGEDGTKAEILAKRAAKANGHRQLEGLVMALKLNASRSVFDLASQDTALQNQIRQAIHNARVRGYRTLDDGSIEVDMDLALGEIWQIVSEAFGKK